MSKSLSVYTAGNETRVILRHNRGCYTYQTYDGIDEVRTTLAEVGPLCQGQVSRRRAEIRIEHLRSKHQHVHDEIAAAGLQSRGDSADNQECT